MFVTKRALSRRTVLKGMGTTLALPFLESMVPAFQALAQSPAKPPMRFGAIYFPNGAPMASPTNYWMPAAAGELEITPILKPLEAVKQQMTVVGNLSRAGGKTVTDHAVSSAGWLSGAVAKQTEAEDIHVGVTIDQVLARQIGQDTPFPSLEVATEDFSGYVRGCVPGYSCTYMNTISWAGPTAPLPMEINPRVAFERMFGRAADGNQRLSRMRENRSILDSVAGEAKQLQRRLGAQDRAAHREDRGPQRREHHGGDGAGGRAGDVRRARGGDVRSAGGGLPGRSDARVHLHDGARGQPAHVPGAQHSRDAPRRVAPRWSTRQDGAAREDRRALRVALRVVRREAAPVARRRRLGARPLAHHLRRRHERRAGAFGLSAAAGGAGRRERADEGQPLRDGGRVDPGGELLVERGRHVRQPDRTVRREQRPGQPLMRT